MAESSFQRKCKAWLKEQGCYVLVVTVIPGIPEGCPDIVALAPNGKWITLECKKDAKAKFQPLQLPTIAKLAKMGYSRATYPENWESIKREILQIL